MSIDTEVEAQMSPEMHEAFANESKLVSAALTQCLTTVEVTRLGQLGGVLSFTGGVLTSMLPEEEGELRQSAGAFLAAKLVNLAEVFTRIGEGQSFEDALGKADAI